MSYVKAKERYQAGEQEQPKEDFSLRCASPGCPDRWSVKRSGEKGLCSYHAWPNAKRYDTGPTITQREMLADIERHNKRGEPQ